MLLLLGPDHSIGGGASDWGERDSPYRSLPEVRPIAEAVPGYTVTGWLGFGAPQGTSPEIIERLNREINTALANPP